MAKAQQFRDQTAEEIFSNLAAKRSEIFKVKNAQRSEGKAAKGESIKQKKKDIARMLTVLREKRDQ